MRFQKIICLIMLIVGALGLLYAFIYCSGSVAELSMALDKNTRTSDFTAAEGLYDATFYLRISDFNDVLMYCGIVMILLSVILYITSCHKRRNYYVSNYVATGVCAGGNIVISIVLAIYNGIWRSEFLKIDFPAWKALYQTYIDMIESGVDTGGYDYASLIHYSESTAMFDLGFAVYAIIIVASLLLVFNMVWKIMLMKGEKRLLAGNQLAGGVV